MCADIKAEEWKKIYADNSSCIQTSANAAWRAYKKNFLRNAKTFDKSGSKLDVFAYDKNQADETEKFLKEYFEEDTTNVEAYLNILHSPFEMQNARLAYLARDSSSQKIVSFFTLEVLPDKTGVVVAHVSSRQRGLSEHMHLVIAEKFSEQGVRRFNVGGSENRQTLFYRKKLAPVECRVMQMLAYDPYYSSPKNSN